jgi:hypothetical protein
VRVVADVGAAVALLAREKPDAIVIEPAIVASADDRDVAEIVRVAAVDTPIVLYTSLPVPILTRAREARGVATFVSKKAGPYALVGCLALLLRL